jgi:hypothetical protein
MVDAIQQRFHDGPNPAWPVFGLADQSGRGWVCGLASRSGGPIDVIRIDYREPSVPERLFVQSQTAGSGRPSLAPVLARLADEDDDGEPVWIYDQADSRGSPEHAEIVVDGAVWTATTAHQGASRAWLMSIDRVVVLVAVRGVELDQVSLIRVDDLAPLIEHRAVVVADLLGRRGCAPGPDAGAGR